MTRVDDHVLRHAESHFDTYWDKLSVFKNIFSIFFLFFRENDEKERWEEASLGAEPDKDKLAG